MVVLLSLLLLGASGGWSAQAQLFPPWERLQPRSAAPQPPPPPGVGRDHTNLGAGKSGQELFASDCASAGCHDGPANLAHGRSVGQLALFLRAHYTTSRQNAFAIADYLTELDRGAIRGDRPRQPATGRPLRQVVPEAVQPGGIAPEPPRPAPKSRLRPKSEEKTPAGQPLKPSVGGSARSKPAPADAPEGKPDQTRGRLGRSEPDPAASREAPSRPAAPQGTGRSTEPDKESDAGREAAQDAKPIASETPAVLVPVAPVQEPARTKPKLELFE